MRQLLSSIDWPCEVNTLFHDENLGSRIAIPLAISWFFECVPFGAIIEDDCVANEGFFDFCAHTLARFTNDSRIASISGTNFHTSYGQTKTGSDSYYFSRYNHAWGWATWRDRWFSAQTIDFTPNSSVALRNCLNNAELHNPVTRWYWKRLFYKRVAVHTPNWDYRWLFCSWHSNKLSIIPQKNLIANIGHGAAATNTHDDNSPFSNMTTFHLRSPYRDPTSVTRNRWADAKYDNKVIIQRKIIIHAARKFLLDPLRSTFNR